MDFQLAVLPSSHPMSTRGFDTLVISQTKDLAKEHLRNLRRMILRSKKYAKWLIDKPAELDDSDSIRSIMRDEKTKTAVIYIRNPEDESSPSRIIALGADNSGSLESWPNIKHIHVSDITATIGDYSESLNVAITRLANTNGTMIIETIPGPAFGPIYEMAQSYSGEPKTGQFKLFMIPASEGVKHGIISREFLANEKARLGPLYAHYYECDFTSSGNAWYDSDLFEYDTEDTTEVTL
jgi:hypothetical protein